MVRVVVVVVVAVVVATVMVGECSFTPGRVFAAGRPPGGQSGGNPAGSAAPVPCW